MAEYIEREKLAKALEIWQNTLIEIYGEDDEYVRCLNSVLFSVDNAPAADVRPVVRGEWEHTEDFDEYGGGRYVEWTCSVCFRKAKGGWAVRDEHIDEPPTWNFCPNCGADMREES